eukprot:1150748-Pelagomonas_calceolata.AAC.2
MDATQGASIGIGGILGTGVVASAGVLHDSQRALGDRPLMFILPVRALIFQEYVCHQDFFTCMSRAAQLLLCPCKKKQTLVVLKTSSAALLLAFSYASCVWCAFEGPLVRPLLACYKIEKKTKL